ncbi:MAG TPA: D-alanine--D-alanine ligase [Candidatus Eisenbacteria bacterium]|jgi:D-alanine-D-alanine ligase
MKVALLMGGRSAEREISLRTGRGIAQALRNLGHEVTAVDAANGRLLPAGEEQRAALPAEAVQKLPASSTSAVANASAINEAEVVFLALHGGAGEDGTIQALLELAGKPYTGSGVLASALAMNKAMSKRVFEQEGIPTPEWVLLSAGDESPTVDAEVLGGYPLVIKPNTEGSTVGLTIVARPDGLAEAIALAAEYGPEVLVERYIPGRELTVAVLGSEALPIVEIKPQGGHYDYEHKYTAGMSDYSCPADLPEPLAARVRDLGLRAAKALGCRGVARVDFRLDPAGVAWCLEVNTIPGMTPTSLVPMAAKARGISYDQLVGRMLDLAAAEWRRRHRRTRASGERART